MRQGAGSQWDPHIIEHFMACRHDLYPICERGIGESVCVAVEHAVRSANKRSWELPLNAANAIDQPAAPA
jgi:hypothetical protein